MAEQHTFPQRVLDKIEEARRTGATQLDLSGNQLSSLPESITQLTNLTRLDLSSNQLSSLPESITQLTNLTTLYLSSNQLSSLPESITQLTKLTTLYLSSNQLSSLPESITQLTNLTTLYLSSNQLSSLPESITQLTNLTQLDLSSNQLSSLPESITQLTNLTQLYLSSNQLSSLPESITQLTNLTLLDLSSNQLSSLPESITQLTNLTLLDLSSNQLSSLPESITQLTNLTSLYLHDNQLSSLPESITQLTNLTQLYLSSNQLSSLPESITQLTNLTQLYLSYNQLSSLPESITQLTNLTLLDLSSNPLVAPPPEIANEGIEAIRNYFEELAKNSVKLYEAKMLLIGQGVVGKTSLKHKLIDPTFDIRSISEDDRTHGIEIDQWPVTCELENEPKDITLNIWDFGGQEVYHATHQFFLTKRSLYILLGDTTRQDNQFRYWLNVVNLLGGNAPVLVVMNKVDLQQAQLNQPEFTKSFPQIHNFHQTSLVTGEGMEDLHRQIRKSLATLDHLGDLIPKSWNDIRTQLKEDGRDYISYDEYLDICEEYELAEDRAATLIGYLHDLGNVLHFKDNELLTNYVILNPEWGTEAVYQVLDPKLAPDFIRKKSGRFILEDLRKIWTDRKQYPRITHTILLELMRSFELCFQLHETKHHIVPELLPESPPEGVDLSPFQTHEKLQFEYRYTFMPKGLMTRFICRIHQLIKEEAFWKAGVLLQYEGSEAFVNHLSLKERKITVELIGSDNRDLLTIIRREFDHIHKSLNNLQVEQMVPCNCSECIESKEPYFYKYSDLKRRVKKRKLTIECGISYEALDVQKLLEGIQYSVNIHRLNNLLAQDRIEEAIAELERSLVDSKELVILRGELTQYRKSLIRDDENREHLKTDRNRLVRRIMDLAEMSLGG